MSDSTIQIPPDSTGPKLDTEELAVGANTVQRQRLEIAGAGAADIVEIAAADPTSGQRGLIVRGVNTPIILARLNSLAAVCTHRVYKTGQTPTLPLNPAPTGSDGNLQKGLAWPNPRFTDPGDGTIRDNLTGLYWLKKINDMGESTWATALTNCNALASGAHGLTDGSVAGNWRMPNVQELLSVLAWCYSSPPLCNTAGTGQATNGDPFTFAAWLVYWTSTTAASGTTLAIVLVGPQALLPTSKTPTSYTAWPCRNAL